MSVTARLAVVAVATAVLMVGLILVLSHWLSPAAPVRPGRVAQSAPPPAVKETDSPRSEPSPGDVTAGRTRVGDKPIAPPPDKPAPPPPVTDKTDPEPPP